jgi:hypothetical protein
MRARDMTAILKAYCKATNDTFDKAHRDKSSKYKYLVKAPDNTGYRVKFFPLVFGADVVPRVPATRGAVAPVPDAVVLRAAGRPCRVTDRYDQRSVPAFVCTCVCVCN